MPNVTCTRPPPALHPQLSMTEVRGRKGICGGSCSSYGCLKGSKTQQGEGLQTDGCPLQYHSAQLPDNAACIM